MLWIKARDTSNQSLNICLFLSHSQTSILSIGTELFSALLSKHWTRIFSMLTLIIIIMFVDYLRKKKCHRLLSSDLKRSTSFQLQKWLNTFFLWKMKQIFIIDIYSLYQFRWLNPLTRPVSPLRIGKKNYLLELFGFFTMFKCNGLKFHWKTLLFLSTVSFHFKGNIQNADRGPAIVCFKHVRRLFILATKLNRQVFIQRERRMHLFIHFIIIVQHSFC